ncbi:flagellin, partial [Kosakonia pseudosacchari]|uniref:flagellin n=1 Tax=Kosakonia pseudosacchari TaxID=1646340 RepID=UPI000A38F969
QNSSNSASDIDSIQAEVNQRLAEIDRVTKQTDFNGIKILNNDTAKTFNFQVGSKDGETIGITMNDSSGWNLYSATATAGSGNASVSGTDRKIKVSGFDVLTATGTSGTTTTGALSTIDDAIKAVDTQRSLLGASQNRFESTISNLNNTVNNLSSARSRIQDSDYATEVSNMSRAQILQQAGSSVLAQANQVPQTMLSLLR